jgi:small subunit ribosomal protein S11
MADEKEHATTHDVERKGVQQLSSDAGHVKNAEASHDKKHEPSQAAVHEKKHEAAHEKKAEAPKEEKPATDAKVHEKKHDAPHEKKTDAPSATAHSTASAEKPAASGKPDDGKPPSTPPAGAPPPEAPRRFTPREMHWAVCNVYSSKNDTIITITDLSGAETLAKASGGMIVKADREEGKPYAAMQAAIKAVNEVKNRGINGLHIRIRAPGGHGSRTPGAGAQAVVRTIARQGIRVGKIEEVTPIPTDTTKRPGGRRGRRV